MTNESGKFIRRMVVAGLNASGLPDLYAVKVTCTQAQYDAGDHYYRALDAAKDEHYEPCLEIDQDDPAGKLLASLFDWDSIATVAIEESY